jgi:hypothetical protein
MDNATRTHYRELLAGLAAKTQEKIPALNGRISKACRLVLGADVTLHPDGTALVGSLTDPARAYEVAGSPATCQCKDYNHAPEHLCCHRLAVGFARKVQELLGKEAPTQEPLEAPRSPLPEARCSVNVHLTIQGRDCLVTLRDHDETALLARLEKLLAQPQAASQPQPQPRREAGPVQDVGWCQKHGVEMTLQSKNGQQWWSHHTPEGWCKGK